VRRRPLEAWSAAGVATTSRASVVDPGASMCISPEHAVIVVEPSIVV